MESPQNTGPAMIAHPLYAKAGWVEGDTSQPFNVPGIYSRPYVATAGGHRAGPISGYFEGVDPGGTPVSGLEILHYSKCDLIDFDTSGAATAVALLPGAAAWTSRSRAPPAPPGWLPAECW